MPFSLGKVSSVDKPSLFRLVPKTANELEANMILMHVAVTVTVSGELQGELQRDNDALNLAPEIQPATRIGVMLPVLVNS